MWVGGQIVIALCFAMMMPFFIFLIIIRAAGLFIDAIPLYYYFYYNLHAYEIEDILKWIYNAYIHSYMKDYEFRQFCVVGVL